MASLGILGSTETLTTTPEDVKGLWGKTGEDPFNKTESPSLARGEVQPGQRSEGHGNESTHGKSVPANSQKDTDEFSFRNYILGISEIKTTQSLDGCSVNKQEKKTEFDTQERMPLLSELETKHSCNEIQTERGAISENECLTEEHGVHNVTIKANTTHVCEKVTLLKVIEAAESKKEHLDETRTAICETAKDGDSVHATQEGSNLQVKETGTLSQMHPEGQMEVNTRSDFDKKPKKGKKKSRKKKKTVVQAKEDFQPFSLPSVGTHVDSVTNVQVVTQGVLPNVTCAQQPDNVVNYKQQLSPGEKPSPRPPLSSPASGMDHLTYLAFSPASMQAPLQASPNSDDHNLANASYSANHCTETNTQHDRNGNSGIINSQNIPLTCVQTTVVCPSASAHQRSNEEMRDAVVSNGAVRPPQEDQRLPLDSQVSVGEDGVESALEEAVVAVAALPLTTPTIRVLIEGEGEIVRHDSLEGVATVAFIEGEKAVGEECLKGKHNCVGDVGTEKERLLDSPELSLIPSQETCSLAFSATGQHTSKESCSSKMPHNVVEVETKGQENICNTETEVSSMEGQAKEKETLFLEAFNSTSPYGLLTGSNCLDHSAVSLEAAEEGGEEDMKQKGGLASEHITFSQPEGSVGGVSSAETEMCPPTDVAESLLKPQYRSEQIPTITESLCIEKDQSSHCWKEQQDADDLPLSTLSEQSSSNTNEEVRTEGKLNVISEEAQPSMDSTCEDSSTTQEEKKHIQVQVLPQPQTTSPGTSIKEESNNLQQVVPEGGAFEARTAKASSQFQVQVYKGKQAMSSVGLHVCDYSGSKNKMHFEDLKNMSVLATDFDSLPPLTVHENLQHPVVETSYVFQDFLNNNKAEISTSVADRKDEPPTWSPSDLTQNDAQLTKGKPEIKDHINLNDDNANFKANTLDLKSTDETHSKLFQCSNDKNPNEKYLALTQNEIYETGQLKVEPLPENVVNLLGAEEKELDKLSVELELPLSSPAEGDVPIEFEKRESNHNLSFCPVLPANNDDACKHFKNVFTELPDLQLTEPFTSAAAEIAAVSCTDSPQPPTQLDKPPLCGLDPSDPLKATLEDSASLQEDKPASVVAASNQLISAASGHAFVLQPSGPMLNHLEVIADCNSSTLEKTNALRADDIMEVLGKESVELTMMSVPRNNIENRNDTVESDILINNFTINDIKVDSVLLGMGQTESDGAVLQSPPEHDVTGKAKGDLNNISSSLSVDLPDDEVERDNVKEKSTPEDQTYEKRWVEGSTDNRQETDNNRLEIGRTPGQPNSQDKAFEQVSGQNAESLLDDMKNEGKQYEHASEGYVKTSFLPDSHPEAPENSADVQSGRESADVDKCLCQNLTETLQCSSEWETAQSEAVPAQSQSNCLDPQQALFPGINLVAEKGDSFVGDLRLFGSQNETMIDVAKREDGTEANQVHLSHFASPLNDDGLDSERGAIADVGRELDSSHVGDGKLKLDDNKLSSLSVGGTADLLPGTELLSELGGKVQEENNVPAVCHGTPETSMNTDISVVPASEEQGAWPFPVSCTSEVSTGSDDIDTEAVKSGNEANGIHRQTFGTLLEPGWQRETVKKDSTTAKSNSSDTEECEIQHTVDKPLKLQSFSVTSASQNDVGEPALAKYSTKENASIAKQSAVCGKRAIKKEGMETDVLVSPQEESAEDGGTGTIKVSDFNACEESHLSSETTVYNTEESVCAFKAIEHHDSLAYKRTDGITVSSVISSKCSTDLSSPVAVPRQSEKIHDQTVLSKPEDTIAVDAVVASMEGRSLHKGSSCNSAVEEKTANTETEDASQNLTADLRTQDQSTVWIEALKEAAAHCQSKQQIMMVISR